MSMAISNATLRILSLARWLQIEEDEEKLKAEHKEPNPKSEAALPLGASKVVPFAGAKQALPIPSITVGALHARASCAAAAAAEPERSAKSSQGCSACCVSAMHSMHSMHSQACFQPAIFCSALCRLGPAPGACTVCRAPHRGCHPVLA
jgi:hypothetical protein